MGFLQSFKQTFNIAGMEIAVQTGDEIYSQGDSVRGHIQLHGGQYERSGQAITLELKEFWTETRTISTGKTTTTTTVTVDQTHQEVELTPAFTLPPEGEYAYPFEVQLPLNARISTPGTGWTIFVRLDIPRAVDPTGSVELVVLPSEELLALIQGCELGLRFREELRRRHWNPATGATYFRLLPPEVLKPELDYLALELQQTGQGGVRGNLIFNLQEKSIGDYFRALLGRDKVTRSVELTSEQILQPSGEAHPEALIQALSPLLEEIISQRG